MTFVRDLETIIPGAPDGVHVAPRDIEEVALILRQATSTGTPVRIWGGGTKQKLGLQPPPGYVLSTQNLKAVEHWEPDDMTLVVGAGARVEDIETMLSSRRQTAVLPERPGSATVGGSIAAGISSLRRARLYGLRERVLETTLVTGDGRIVRSGGRVVKNVSGYDIHRAVVGAFGSLGVVVSVCLKLWPVPESAVTLRLDDPGAASAVERPLALLESNDGVDLYVWGTKAEVEQAAERTDGVARSGLQWPDDPSGLYRWSLRVPPASIEDGLSRIGDWRYLAVHGVGEIRLGSDSADGAGVLRSWAEERGGHLVLTDHPGTEPTLDPWGSVPQTVALQRRLIHEFDPARVINPNRLPGGV